MSDTTCTKCGGTKFYTFCKNCEENPHNTIAAIKAQRDELLEAANGALTVLIQDRDHTPMSMRIESRHGAIRRLSAAIASAEKTP